MTRKGRLSGKREKTVEIDVTSVISVFLIVLVGVLCFWGARSLALGFVSVRNFEVVGGERVEGSELAAYADISRKDKLSSIDLSDAQDKILQNCAYIERVKIRTGITGKIKFIVTERIFLKDLKS